MRLRWNKPTADGVMVGAVNAGLEARLDERGLTGPEARVADALVDAFNGYAALPVQHPDDLADVRDAIHRVQDLLAMRIARRHYPKGWPNKGATT